MMVVLHIIAPQGTLPQHLSIIALNIVPKVPSPNTASNKTGSTANNANGRNFGTSSNYGSNGRLSLSDVADSSGGKFSSVSKPRRVSLYS